MLMRRGVAKVGCDGGKYSGDDDTIYYVRGMLGVSIENTKTFFLHLFTLIVSSFTSESNKQFSINSTVYRYMLQLIMSIITIDN